MTVERFRQFCTFDLGPSTMPGGERVRDGGAYPGDYIPGAYGMPRRTATPADISHDFGAPNKDRSPQSFCIIQSVEASVHYGGPDATKRDVLSNIEFELQYMQRTVFSSRLDQISSTDSVLEARLERLERLFDEFMNNSGAAKKKILDALNGGSTDFVDHRRIRPGIKIDPHARVEAQLAWFHGPIPDKLIVRIEYIGRRTRLF